MKRIVLLLAIDSIPSSYLGQHKVHLHFVTKFKSWTLGFSLRVPNRYVMLTPTLSRTVALDVTM